MAKVKKPNRAAQGSGMPLPRYDITTRPHRDFQRRLISRVPARNFAAKAQARHIEVGMTVDRADVDNLMRPLIIMSAAASSCGGIPSVRARSFAVPMGRIPNGSCVSIRPSAPKLIVPSPGPVDDAVYGNLGVYNCL